MSIIDRKYLQKYKIDITDFVDETLANISEMKNVKCNNIYSNMLKLKIDFEKFENISLHNSDE